MKDAFYAQALAPFMLALMLFIGYPIKRWVIRKMKHGKLRTILLLRLDGSNWPPNPKKIAKRAARKRRVYGIGYKAAAIVARTQYRAIGTGIIYVTTRTSGITLTGQPRR